MRNTYKKYNKSKKNLTRKLLGGARKQIRHKNHKSGENFSKLNLSLQVAKLFVETNNSFDEISTFLQKELKTGSYKEFRKKLAGSDTDGECKIAAKVAESLDSADCKCTGFIDSSERNIINEYYKTNKEFPDYADENWFIANEDNENLLPFNTLGVKIGIQNRETNKYKYSGRSAGPCWLCNEPVYFYFDGQDKTGCGECEHVGSIMPSLFAGMLARQNLSAFIYNYGLSHVHCNQKKTNMVSMIFNHGTLKWQYDTGSTKKIVNTILNGRYVHGSEYCPEFKDKFSVWKGKAKKSRQSKDMIKRIKEHTEVWVTKANEQLTSIEHNRDKIKNATKLVQAIQFMVEKSIDKSRTISGGAGRRASSSIIAPDGFYNYDGLNINIDDNNQIKETYIKDILAYIRANKCVFETFVQILQLSVNDTKLYLTTNLTDDEQEESLINSVILEEAVSKEVAAAEVAAAEALAAEALAAQAAAQAAAVQTPNKKSARPTSFVTPQNSQFESQSQSQSQPLMMTQEHDEEDPEISEILHHKRGTELFGDKPNRKGASSVIQNISPYSTNRKGASSVPLPLKRTSPWYEGEQRSQSPKIADGTSPHSFKVITRGGKRKRRTRKKKRK